MPSKFPGMDPFLEAYFWDDFHGALVAEIKKQLAPLVTPRYSVALSQRVYVEHFDQGPGTFVPEVHAADEGPLSGSAQPNDSSPVTEPEPHMVPLPVETRESFLEVHDFEFHRVVTIIEVLSPSNKSRGTDGFRVYETKREDILRMAANLVEIDLVRFGERPAIVPPIRTSSDYAVSVHRERKRPAVDVFQWSVRRQLPRIPIPLAGTDADAVLDLQQVFDKVWTQSKFSDSLQYTRPLQPPIRTDDEAWVREILKT